MEGFAQHERESTSNAILVDPPSGAAKVTIKMESTNVKELQHIAALDPASGKTNRQLKKVGARSAIVVIGYDEMRNIFVRLAWAARVKTTVLRERIFEVADLYNPRYFSIEANAMQSTFYDLMVDENRIRGRAIKFVPFYPPTQISKDSRIRECIQPPMAEGRLFLGPNLTELRDELQTFPVGDMKDLVDALAQAISMVPRKASNTEQEGEKQAYLTYLRDSGASIRYIEAVSRYGVAKADEMAQQNHAWFGTSGGM